MDADLIWQAAQAWWHEKARTEAREKPFTNLDHTNNPTIGCTTPAECALALAVASKFRLQWIYENA